MNCIYRSCQGDSHLLSDKPCQDYSFASTSDSLSMAIVSDGHGGERYFRSQFGSEFAVKITREAITSFVEAIAEDGNKILENEPFTEYIAGKASEEIVKTVSHHRLMWLFSSIISQWNQKIDEHARANELSDWEKAHVDKKYQDEFNRARNDCNSSFEKTYGCTLMAYVQTPTYWFAFQLGDGKLVTMHKTKEVLECKQPVPWDERCFLNKTTSICDSHALDEIRYCYEGDGSFPIAAFLGSDGLDDTYGDGEKLYNFYIELYKQIAKSGVQVADNVLKNSLPKISKVGSKDDMSVAAVFDDTCLDQNFYCLLFHQRTVAEKERFQLEQKIKAQELKIESFTVDHLSKSEAINFEYAKKDLEKLKALHKRTCKRIRDLQDDVVRFDNGKRNSHKIKNPKHSNTLAFRKNK